MASNLENRDIEIHPLANEFPPMSDLEFESLKQDIDAHGLRESIVLFEDKILDGRNRYRACRELGVPFHTSRFEGDFIAAREYSASKNLLRRHLTKSQKAMIIVVAGLVMPPAEDGRRRANGTGQGAIMEQGSKYGVNHVTLYKAAYVRSKDTALAERVINGEISVGSAEKKLKAVENEAVDHFQKKKPNRWSPSRPHSSSGDFGSSNAGSLFDDLGSRIPDELVDLFKSRTDFDNLARALATASRTLGRLRDCGVIEVTTLQEMMASVDQVLEQASVFRPTTVCDSCSGGGCSECKGRGWQGPRSGAHH